jgi:DNA modification methylase
VVVTWRVVEGDCRDTLASLDAGSVQTCVTSPPYFGLRDYGHEGQIGLEPTPDEFVAALVGVFREVRRVLRDDGTVWLNLGDSYAGSWGAQSRVGNFPSDKSTLTTNNGRGPKAGDKYSALSAGQIAAHPRGQTQTGAIPKGADYKAKDLIGIPWMVAFALRADGWFLRSDIIWAKPNPMPESVTDRPTKAHEYLFLLSKGPRYWYDHEAIKEQHDTADTDARNRADFEIGRERNRGGRTDGYTSGTTPLGWGEGGRNKRSVWTVATQPFPGAHFATFPPKLIEPCILAGCPERMCGECGAPWERIVERTKMVVKPTPKRAEWQATDDHARTQVGGTMTEPPTSRTVGFAPSCGHDAPAVPGTVLDPFAGAGTTGMVALRHGRSFIGCELSPDYVRLARDRIIADSPLLNSHAEAA